MNCCDDNGKCTGGNGCAARTVRSCDELAVCQQREPRCDGCISGMQLTSQGIRFAPGAVEKYRAPFFGSPAQRRELLRWLKPSLAFTAAVILAGLAAGLIAGWLS
jgi:hypothetical protein